MVALFVGCFVCWLLWWLLSLLVAFVVCWLLYFFCCFVLEQHAQCISGTDFFLTIVCVATLRQKLQIKLAISRGHWTNQSCTDCVTSRGLCITSTVSRQGAAVSPALTVSRQGAAVSPALTVSRQGAAVSPALTVSRQGASVSPTVYTRTVNDFRSPTIERKA